MQLQASAHYYVENTHSKLKQVNETLTQDGLSSPVVEVEVVPSGDSCISLASHSPVYLYLYQHRNGHGDHVADQTGSDEDCKGSKTWFLNTSRDSSWFHHMKDGIKPISVIG